jgi:hypothetical protein
MMQEATTIQAPPPPPPPGGVIVSQRTVDRAMSTAPMTRQDIAALQARRRELSIQLNSADGRRKELSKLARNATGADKTGLEQRLGVLDGRMAGLESDLADVGRQLASAPAALVGSQQDPWIGWGPNTQNRFGDNLAPLAGLFTIFVLSPIAISIARSVWKRGSRPRQTVASGDAQRLERMEQAMDAIAIEIERVSEGQRFVTRLLAERGGANIEAGQQAKERVKVPVKQPTPV